MEEIINILNTTICFGYLLCLTLTINSLEVEEQYNIFYINLISIITNCTVNLFCIVYVDGLLYLSKNINVHGLEQGPMYHALLSTCDIYSVYQDIVFCSFTSQTCGKKCRGPTIMMCSGK